QLYGYFLKKIIMGIPVIRINPTYLMNNVLVFLQFIYKTMFKLFLHRLVGWFTTIGIITRSFVTIFLKINQSYLHYGNHNFYFCKLNNFHEHTTNQLSQGNNYRGR